MPRHRSDRSCGTDDLRPLNDYAARKPQYGFAHLPGIEFRPLLSSRIPPEMLSLKSFE